MGFRGNERDRRYETRRRLVDWEDTNEVFSDGKAGMNSFVESPISNFFLRRTGEPRRSPTVQLLLSRVDAAGVMAAIEGGWLDPTQFGFREDPNAMPALAVWMQSPGSVENSAKNWPVHPQWPISPSESWSGVSLPEGMNYAYENLSMEWCTGWCISQSPVGLGALRWTVRDSDFSSSNPPKPPGPLRVLGVISVAVSNRWGAVVDQLLRRPDRPTASELDAMSSSGSMYTTAVNEKSGQLTESSGSQHLPLLHSALEKGALSIVQCLLEAGCNPNALDSGGTPAFFRAKSVETLELLLAHGATLDLPASHGVSLASWWEYSLKSSLAASPLVARANEWMRSSVPSDRLVEQKMPEIARRLNGITLVSLKNEVEQLKISADQTWEENGTRWTLGAYALKFSLEEPFSELSSAKYWASARGDIGHADAILPGLHNADAMWLLGTARPKLMEHWQKKYASKNPMSLPRFSALLKAVRDWGQAFPFFDDGSPSGGFSKKRYDAACVWLLRATGTWLAQHPEDTVSPWDEESPVVQALKAADGLMERENRLPNDFVREGQELLEALRVRVWENRKIGHEAAASRWLGEAIVLASRLKETSLYENQKNAIEAFENPSKFLSWKREEIPSRSVPVWWLAHAVRWFDEDAIGLSDGTGGRRLGEAWDRLRGNPALCFLAMWGRQATLGSALEPSPDQSHPAAKMRF